MDAEEECMYVCNIVECGVKTYRLRLCMVCKERNKTERRAIKGDPMESKRVW